MSIISSNLAFKIGLFGVLIFTIVLSLGIFSRIHAINKYTKRVFLLLCISAIFELPRYYHMVIHRVYSGQVVYSMHLVANLFYFASFSCLCFCWGDALRAMDLEELFAAKQRRNMRIVIVAANIIFMAHTLYVIYVCLTVDNLEAFFDERIFRVYTISDTFKNFIMGLFIAKFGGQLYARVENYSAFYSRNSTDVVESTKHLLTAAGKLKYLVIIINLCFTLRVLAVTLWMASNRTTENQEPTSFPSCSFIYWIVFEIVPVVVPALALCFTMGWLARLWGGVFIDRNKPKAEPVQRCSRYSSDSNIISDDSSLEANLRTMAQPFLTAPIDEEDGEKGVFNRLSSVSGEFVDVDIDRNSNGAPLSARGATSDQSKESNEKCNNGGKLSINSIFSFL